MEKAVKKKITVQMWRPVIERLNSETALACLNRDAYLDRILFDEAENLLAEAQGRTNSSAAKGYVKQCFLDLRDHRMVSFNLSTTTVQAIDEACRGVNTWRDVFMNRVVFLLVAKAAAIERELGVEVNHHREEIFDAGWEIKALLLGPRVAAIRALISDDAFMAYRIALRSEYPDTEGRLHMQPFGRPSGHTPAERGLVGLSTFLEDVNVPSTPAGQEHEKMMSAIFGELNLGTKEGVK